MKFYMISIRKLYDFTSSKGLPRAERYTLHTKRNKERLKYVLGLNLRDGGSHYYYHSPNIKEALIEAIEISNRLPQGNYEDWSKENKEKAENEAIYYYNKYGHLGLKEYMWNVIEYQYSGHYDIFGYESDSYFLPLYFYKNKKELGNDKALEKTSDDLAQERKSILHDIKEISKRMIFEKDLGERNKIIEKLNELNEKLKLKKTSTTEFYDSESIGEPVFMFVDFIWFLARCLNTWDRYLRDNPPLYSRYEPNKFDDLNRLVNKFEFPFTQVEKDEDGLYFDIYGYLDKNCEVVKSSDKYKFQRTKNYMYFPLWKDVLDYYGERFVLNLEMNFEKSEPIMRYNAESLFQSMYFALLADVEKDLKRDFRICKNPNCLNFVYQTGNRQKLYCSTECASAHNSYKTRQRKAGLKVET